MVNIKAALEGIVGAENVSDEDYELVAYSRDMSPYPPRKADLIVLPNSSQEVSDILRLANQTGTPVYPKGGGTGCGGMNIARMGGIIVDLIRMNKILEINENTNTITTQAGCGAYKAVKALRKKGLRFALLPEFGSSVPMGGWTSCTACGYNQFSHGYLWDHLIGMEVVLPTGEIVRTGLNAYQNCGPIGRYVAFGDLTGIFIGAMGMYGIVTEVTYSIFTEEEAVNYINLGFDNWDSVIKTIRRFTRTPHVIKELGLVDNSLGAIMGVQIESPIILVIDCAGTKEQADYGVSVVRRIGEENGAKVVDAPIGQILHDNAALLNGPSKINGGYDCPGSFGAVVEELPALYKALEEVSQKYKMGFFAYVWFTRNAAVPFPMFIFSEPEQLEAVREAHLELVDRWLQIKNVSVGYQAPWPDLSVKLRPTYYELVRKIKRALDPNNIMQPGMAPY